MAAYCRRRANRGKRMPVKSSGITRFDPAQAVQAESK
jgi:hypothetical protein